MIRERRVGTRDGVLANILLKVRGVPRAERARGLRLLSWILSILGHFLVRGLFLVEKNKAINASPLRCQLSLTRRLLRGGGAREGGILDPSSWGGGVVFYP